MVRKIDSRYQKLFDRIEQEIDVDELSAEEIKLLISNRAYRGLNRGNKDLLLLTSRIIFDIGLADNEEELDRLLEDSKALVIHKKEVMRRISEKRAELRQAIKISEEFEFALKGTVNKIKENRVEKVFIKRTEIKRRGKIVACYRDKRGRFSCLIEKSKEEIVK